MNFIPFLLFISFFAKIFISNKESKNEQNNGVYVITTEVLGPKGSNYKMKLPDDSIFMIKDMAIEKDIQINQNQFNNSKIEFTLSVKSYYLIDLQKGLFKDIGAVLENETKQIPWQDLKNKTNGFNFYYGWYRNENHIVKDTVYNGKKIKKLNFTSKFDNFKYEVYLETNPVNIKPAIFFIGIEDTFNSSLVRLEASNDKGCFIFTKNFIAMKDHEILRKISQCSNN